MQITEERETELLAYWGDETNDSETLQWRNDLTAEEMQLVEEWDYKYVKGMSSILKRILDMSEKLEKTNK